MGNSNEIHNMHIHTYIHASIDIFCHTHIHLFPYITPTHYDINDDLLRRLALLTVVTSVFRYVLFCAIIVYSQG